MKPDPFLLGQRLALLSSALAAFLLALFGVTWWLGPEHTALIFGVSLSGPAVAYGRVKGTEDLLAAAVLAVGSARGKGCWRSAALAAGSLVPVGDLAALLSVGIVQPSVLWIHVAFIIVMGASAVVLHFERKSP